ncbi:BCCT family transporter [Aquisalimonas lutea]|uniref:BCCT family transporter n=1 Tax=Aquisalimonas lutea TaxID=1327750 RepID=UPI0025B4C34B|nr:BCCT family transporter [Aquisalimonas lutea]MDN3519348.1 BCCT family transporter [Aquisalimonas lutea]
MTDQNQNPDDYNPVVETDYEVGQDNVRPLGLELHNPVFFITALGTVLAVLFTAIFPDAAFSVMDSTRKWLESTFDWVYMGAANIFVIVCLILMLGPTGRIRLGGPSARPEFSYASWFGMLFAAGMGIGLMFFGVLEPFYHYFNPPFGMEAEGEAARNMAMAATIFHWGLHPWAIYAVVAGCLAFFSFNYGLPLTVRSAFFPILGDRVWGWFGHIIDVLAVFATMFGLTTSLGLGAQQAAAGLNHVFGVFPEGLWTTVPLIAVITCIALGSVVLGVQAGVRRLSNLNMVLFAILGVFVLFAGYTVDILINSVTSIGHYLANVVPLSNPVGREDTGFMHGWTVFYWAWWISWAPFVGMFIARVSYGRTVREFMISVLIVPVLATVVWMNIMGGFAIDQYVSTGATGVYQHVVESYDSTMPLFGLLESMPLPLVASTLAIFLVIVFFVTSSDSGSLVIDTISAGGKTDAPVAQRVFWATFEGLVAIVLLLSGGTAALQAVAITLGFPFALVLLSMAACMIYAMFKEAPNYKPATA